MENPKEILIKEGLILPVMEHFYSLQGEGFYSGYPSYFLRLGGCDVGCHWCDVKESWDADIHELMPIEEILKLIITEKSDIIIITGGEPLMWNLNPLTKMLKEKKTDIHF